MWCRRCWKNKLKGSRYRQPEAIRQPMSLLKSTNWLIRDSANNALDYNQLYKDPLVREVSRCLRLFMLAKHTEKKIAQARATREYSTVDKFGIKKLIINSTRLKFQSLQCWRRENQYQLPPSDPNISENNCAWEGKSHLNELVLANEVFRKLIRNLTSIDFRKLLDDETWWAASDILSCVAFNLIWYR